MKKKEQKNNQYWYQRAQHQNDLNYNRTIKEIDQKLVDLYKNTGKNIRQDIIELVDKVGKPSEEVRINDLYRNNRYFELMNQINQELNELGAEEIKITEENLLEMYDFTSSVIAQDGRFSLAFESPAEQVIDRVWCPDGLHWSNRIWKNKAKMQETLTQGLTDILARGVSKDKLVTEITELVNGQRYMAERLVRTELTHIQNEAAADTYERAGITKYKYLSFHDNRVSDMCKEMDGKVINFKDKKVGVNFPPLHPA